MLKNAVNFLAYTILASTLVLTQGFLGGSPLFSNDGVAVALTKAEKQQKRTARSARRAAKQAAKAERAAARAAAKAERAAARAAAKAEKAAAKAARAAARAAAKAANAKSSKLRRCLRLLFIEVRKYIRQPKIKEIEKVVEKIVEVEKEIVVEKIVPTEVIKEVPVDRVVIQNVPTEVIRKEVIHVPIASDDLTILDVKKIKPATTKGQREDSSKENPEKGEK